LWYGSYASHLVQGIKFNFHRKSRFWWNFRSPCAFDQEWILTPFHHQQAGTGIRIAQYFASLWHSTPLQIEQISMFTEWIDFEMCAPQHTLQELLPASSHFALRKPAKKTVTGQKEIRDEGNRGVDRNQL